MIDAESSLQTCGLSGDHGWSEIQHDSLPGLETVLLLATTSAYFVTTWVLGGFVRVLLIGNERRREREQA